MVLNEKEIQSTTGAASQNKTQTNPSIKTSPHRLTKGLLYIRGPMVEASVEASVEAFLSSF